jgi:hypothetical protein
MRYTAVVVTAARTGAARAQLYGLRHRWRGRRPVGSGQWPN